MRPPNVHRPLIQYTSGTTGSPKAATLSHHNLLNNGHAIGDNLEFAPGDRLCLPVPLHHCFGVVLGSLACISHGGALVLPSPAFDPVACLAALRTEHCTALHGIPAMFAQLLDHPARTGQPLTDLCTGIMAGAPCPEVVFRRVVAELPIPHLTVAYGMTETSPVSFQSTIETPLAA